MVNIQLYFLVFLAYYIKLRIASYGPVSVKSDGSSGNLIFKENERTGSLVTALPVGDSQEVLIVTRNLIAQEYRSLIIASCNKYL